ncbi:MAG: DUF6788 family protein [Nitrospirota bacterium]
MSGATFNKNIHYLHEKLVHLNEKRTRLMFSIIHGKPMIHGMPHEVFRKCGKKNCRCYEGRLHGPYPALYVSQRGTKKIIMIKKDDAPTAIIKSKRYRHYQQTLAKIRKINKEIDSLLEGLKASTIIPYP